MDEQTETNQTLEAPKSKNNVMYIFFAIVVVVGGYFIFQTFASKETGKSEVKVEEKIDLKNEANEPKVEGIETKAKEINKVEQSNVTGIYSIDIQNSTLAWQAQKKINPKHNGTVKFKSGKVEIVKGEVKNGEFVADLTTLEDKDLTDPSKGMLEKHLKGSDFFDVEKFPESKLVIKKVTNKKLEDDGKLQIDITADLTIKDKTNEVVIPAKVYFSDDKLLADSEFEIDRTKWGLRYGSGQFFKELGDKIILDNFKLNLNLVFTINK